MGRFSLFRDGPLANRNYRLFMTGAFVTALGSWLQEVALGWTVYQLGNSAFLLGVLGFVRLAPVLILGVYAGSLADRVDRRRFLIRTQTCATALATCLAILQGSGRASIPAILLIAGANGTVNALNGPTWQSFIKEMVGPAELRRAIAINSARFNLTRIIGPAIGGWLLVQFGAAACFGANALGYLAVIGALLQIRTKSEPASSSAKPGLRGVLEVARTPRIQAVLLPALGLTLLIMPYGSFLPAMARDVFLAGPRGLSTIYTVMGCGALVGAAISGAAFVSRRPGHALAILQLITGAAFAAFAWSPSFILALVCIVFFGAAMIAYMSSANATIQLAAPPGTEGRALGLWIIVNSGLVPIGSIAIGTATEFVGTRNALGIAGVGCALCGIAAYLVAQRNFTAQPTPATRAI